MAYAKQFVGAVLIAAAFGSAGFSFPAHAEQTSNSISASPLSLSLSLSHLVTVGYDALRKTESLIGNFVLESQSFALLESATGNWLSFDFFSFFRSALREMQSRIANFNRFFVRPSPTQPIPEPNPLTPDEIGLLKEELAVLKTDLAALRARERMPPAAQVPYVFLQEDRAALNRMERTVALLESRLAVSSVLPIAETTSLASRITALEQRLALLPSSASEQRAAGFTPSSVAPAPFAAYALSQKISNLANITFSGTNTFNLADSDIPDAITASNYLPVAGGTLSGSLTLSGGSGYLATLAVGTSTTATNQLAIYGSTTVQTWQNVPTAFRILNSATSSVFTANTVLNRVEFDYATSSGMLTTVFASTTALSATAGTITNASSTYLSTLQNLNIGNDLLVTGDASSTYFSTSQNLNVGNDLIITGDASSTYLSTSQNLNIGNDLLITGDASSTYLSTSQNLTVGNSLITAASSTFGGVINVSSGTSTFNGGIAANLLNITNSSATSSFANGITLTNGCFAINGTCVGASNPGWTDDGTTVRLTAATDFVGIGTSTTATNQLAIYGSTTIQTWQNVPTAFQVLNAATTSVFTVDTVNGSTSIAGAANIGGALTVDGILTSRAGTSSLVNLNLSGNFEVRGSATTTFNQPLAHGSGDFTVARGGSGNLLLNPYGGNVGIGTTSPWGFLSINANALSAGTPQFVVGSSTATNFIITNDGNVGIGTTSPYSKLQITGGGTGTGRTFAVVNSASTTLFQVLDNGNVGIGTSSPLGTDGSDRVLEISSVGLARPNIRLNRPGIVEYKIAIDDIDNSLYIVKSNGNVLPRNGVGIVMTSSIIVGIGQTNPDEGKVEVKGGSVCVDTNSDNTASSCIAAESDERLKENITQISGALNTLLKLRGVSFDWAVHDPEVLKHYPLITRFASSAHSLGLIAQEVQPILPEAIMQETVGDSETQYFQLDYDRFTPVIIEAIKELNLKVEDLAAQSGTGGSEDSGISLFDRLSDFLRQIGVFVERGIVRAKEFIADKITAKQLCVEDVCVTREQFLRMARQAGVTVAPDAPQPSLSESGAPDAGSVQEETPAPEPE